MKNKFRRSMAWMLIGAMLMSNQSVTIASEAAAETVTERTTEAPQAQTETQAPETQAPETQAPETQAAETQAPETQAPETQAPETQAPETQAPETQAPETTAPETNVSAPEAAAENAAQTEVSAQTEASVGSTPETSVETEVKEAETETETDPAQTEAEMPAASFDGATTSGIKVTASVGEGVFPAGTEMLVSDVAESVAMAAAEKGTDDDAEVLDAVGVNIRFKTPEGRIIEPADGMNVKVAIELPEKKALEGEEFVVVHRLNDGSAEVIEDASVTENGANFDAESFSIYVITALGERDKDRIVETHEGAYTPNSADSPYILNLDDTVNIVAEIAPGEEGYEEGNFWSDPGNIVRCENQRMEQKADGTRRYYAEVRAIGVGTTAVQRTGYPEKFYIEVLDNTETYDHCDIEIADGGTYTLTQTYHLADGSTITKAKTYNTYVQAVNYCDIFLENNTSLHYPDYYYQSKGKPGESQWELTSKYTALYAKNLGDPVAIAKHVFSKELVEYVQFDVKVVLKPSTETTTFKNANGEVESTEVVNIEDTTGAHDLMVDSFKINMNHRDVIDANNKCPDHTGLDFTIASLSESSLNVPQTTETLSASKVLTDGELADGQFTFELYDGDELLSSKVNAADGSITFDPIIYYRSGTHTYTITEKIPEGADRIDTTTYTLNGITYKVKTITATVKVELVNNTLTPTVSYSETPTFENKQETQVPPKKEETAPYEGTGALGGVKVGQEITYKISYTNYKAAPATVTIRDTLDQNVEFVSASNGGTRSGEGTDGGVVTWSIANAPANTEGYVTLTVRVLASAQEKNGGRGFVANGGETTTVKIGNDDEQSVDEITNPVPEEPHKKETAPYVGTDVLGAVKVGEDITYEISYKNYKTTAANVVITDTLDEHVAFKTADNGGVHKDGIVTWTLENVPAGQEGTVSLTVTVLKSAQTSNGGEGRVVNGGDSTTVKVGDDHAYTVEEVENPVPEVPHKTETAPYEGTGTLGLVDVDDEITYKISYKNYKKEAATVTIKDKLDPNVEFVSADNDGAENDGVVVWTLANVAAGAEGEVSLTVKVKESARKSNGGAGKVVNGGSSTTVQVGDDHEYTVETIENPVPDLPHKKETAPYVGINELGPVNVGDEITYEISFRNYKDTEATVTVTDKLDPKVEFVSASDNGTEKDGVVTWTLQNVAAGAEGKVTLTVKVLKGALASEGGAGKVVNGGETTKVQVDNEKAYTVEPVENPVPDGPSKNETAPYAGNGDLGAVKVGEEITYKISYKNYKASAATVTIKDKLDDHVEFVEASDNGKNENGTVKWTLTDVEAGNGGFVTLKVRVLASALKSNDGPAQVVNGGSTTTVQVGNDAAQSVETVTNPVPEEPHKKEIKPYAGTENLGLVDVGEEITYTISYKNYKKDAATVTIKDTLDKNVEFVSADNDGANSNGIVTWTLTNVAAGAEGEVSLTVKVKESARKSNGGAGKVVNGGSSTTVRVGDDHEYTVETIENPVPDLPHKKETAPYVGINELGPVNVGDEITYEISFRNYKDTAATVTVKDKLDPKVEFDSASDNGTAKDGVVTWTVNNVAAGAEGKVTLTVKVLKGALTSEGGAGKVVNGGKDTTVKVDNDKEYSVESVENPVPDKPHKEETAPYTGTGDLGAVKVGDEITYAINYKNYKGTNADVTIEDTLDKNVEFVSADNNGTYAKETGKVTWLLKDVEANETGFVTLKVKVLASALKSNDGPAQVVNGGETTIVKVGNDAVQSVETVTNPVPEVPHKTETAPYTGTENLGLVDVGDEITYKISYNNYKKVAATVTIKDTLDPNVEFVSADKDGAETDGVVVWTLANIAAGAEGEVFLTVKVKESARKSNGGAGKVVNGGKTTTVQVGDDHEYTVETIENPVPDLPHKKETAPYEGINELGPVNIGDNITYEIRFRNYKDTAATVTVKDKLDPKVEFVSASDGGAVKDGVVSWTVNNVAAGAEGKVTLTVKVLKGALASEGGAGKVVNGGKDTTVKVDNDKEYSVESVENPVPDKPHKEETAPYTGSGDLGAVKVGEEITYKISYRNYKGTKANVTIKDRLDANVELVSASDSGVLKDGVVTWTFSDVAPAYEGTVTLKVKVLESALVSKGGLGQVTNGGDSTTVKVGDGSEYTVDTVTNPVPEVPHKTETAPYEGTGTLGLVDVDDEITYKISYKNYKKEAATVKIKDTLDPNVEFVSADNDGAEANGVVVWTLADVAAGAEGEVFLTVKVKESARKSNGGEGKVVNGGKTTTVQVGDDHEYTVEIIENPVPDLPHKKETAPYVGINELGPVNVGDEITYEISFRNYKDTAATVTVTDKLDPKVEFVSASDNGTEKDGVVTWTVNNVAAGAEGKVTLTVKVLKGALASEGGAGKVVNGGKDTTVKVDNDKEYSVEKVENPVPDGPAKMETAPYSGTGELGAVKVGDEITYAISYKNYKGTNADVTIEDTLDKNVEFVSADNNGTYAKETGKVTWLLKEVEANETGFVTLKVKVLASALKSNGGPAEVVNGGDSTTVQVNNEQKYTVEKVTNPVPEVPHKTETAPYEGTGTLGLVDVDDEITYKISYKNYKKEAATVKIKDTLDPNVEFVSADNDGAEANGVVVWTLADVAAGAEGEVFLTVKVKESARKSNGGEGKVVNGGKTTTVQVGDDHEYTVETIENPVPDLPHKKEVTPYEGINELGPVNVGDEITYEISFRNYKDTAATVTVTDKLDKNVEFVSASDNGTAKDSVVTWTVNNVAAGAEGKVTLTVKVLKGALASEGGAGKVVNGGKDTTVKVDNDKEYSVEKVENPVPDGPSKMETAPYSGTGELGAVKVGDEITYTISYKNYKGTKANVTIEDKLDDHVEFFSADNNGTYAKETGKVTWLLKDVEAGATGFVTLKVKVLASALKSNGGPAEVVNGGETTTVKVGNDAVQSVETATNPVPDLPHKREIAPYVGNGALGAVKVGDEITYEISFKNYKKEAADVTVKDTLDKNVSFISADQNGTNQNGIVTWVIRNVAAGAEGKVTLKVKVLHTAFTAEGGPGKVLNGGETATVRVGNDREYSLELVENPVSEIVVPILKIDAITLKPLAGAQLQIKDADGKLLKEWTSSNKKEEVIGLKTGVAYVLHEASAPYGWDLAEDIPFTINEAGTIVSDALVSDGENGTMLLMSDARRAGVWNHSFAKTDESGNLLAGAALQITDASGNVIASWVTDSKQHEEVLYEGDYTLTETDAPNGYQTAESIKFHVDLKGNVYFDEEYEYAGKGKANVTMVDTKIAPAETEPENDVPRTGDETPILPYTMLLFAAAAMIAGFSRRKHRI